MILYGYKFFVIDHGWDNLVKVDDFLKKTIDNKFSFHDEDIELFQEYISKITQHFKQAKVLATELGWEGDFNFGPSVFFLTDPSRNDMSFGFVFKQYKAIRNKVWNHQLAKVGIYMVSSVEISLYK